MSVFWTASFCADAANRHVPCPKPKLFGQSFLQSEPLEYLSSFLRRIAPKPRGYTFRPVHVPSTFGSPGGWKQGFRWKTLTARPGLSNDPGDSLHDDTVFEPSDLQYGDSACHTFIKQCLGTRATELSHALQRKVVVASNLPSLANLTQVPIRIPPRRGSGSNSRSQAPGPLLA